MSIMAEHTSLMSNPMNTAAFFCIFSCGAVATAGCAIRNGVEAPECCAACNEARLFLEIATRDDLITAMDHAFAKGIGSEAVYAKAETFVDFAASRGFARYAYLVRAANVLALHA